MDRALFEKALKEMSQREGLTPEERKRRCGELLVQAQHMDSEEYLRWMNDSTKRPWVGLTDEEVSKLIDNEIGFNSCWGPEEQFARAIESKLKEKNNG